MLDEHHYEFGIYLTENAPGTLCAPLINTAMTLPQLEYQLYLPTSAHEHKGFIQIQHLMWNITAQNYPTGQFQRLITHWFTLALGF